MESFLDQDTTFMLWPARDWRLATLRHHLYAHYRGAGLPLVTAGPMVTQCRVWAEVTAPGHTPWPRLVLM